MNRWIVALILTTAVVLTAVPLIAQSSGGGGVVSINGVQGQFTFNGAGVSCAGTICTFSGGTITAQPQYTMPCYTAAGTASTLGGCGWVTDAAGDLALNPTLGAGITTTAGYFGFGNGTSGDTSAQVEANLIVGDSEVESPLFAAGALLIDAAFGTGVIGLSANSLTTPDTGISRPSAGVFDFGNGTAGDKSATLQAAGYNATSDGVHAGIMSLVGNTTNPAIPSNQFGWLGFASTSATAYFFQPNTTAPSGTEFLTAGTPSGGVSAINYVPSTGSGSVVLATAPALAGFTCTGSCPIEGTISAGTYTFGASAVNTVVATTIAAFAGHFTQLAVTSSLGGSCTTKPVFNVFDGTSNTGSSITATSTTQTKGNTTNQSQTLTFSAGDVIGIYISTAGATCTTDTWTVSAEYAIP